MRIAAAAIVITAAFATTASAQPNQRLSDMEYLQAARCRGLAASEGLGAMDTAAIDALLKAQGRGRAGFIVDKAENEADRFERLADRASTERKSGLMAERDGACQRYFG